MKNSLVQIIAIVLLLGIGLFSIQKNSTAAPVKAKVLIELNQISPNYYDYSPASLAQAKINGRTLLFFAATTWCSSCSDLDIEIKARSQELPSNLTILKIDFDQDLETKRAYQITTQHTVIMLDSNGKETKRWVGGNFDTLITQAK